MATVRTLSGPLGGLVEVLGRNHLWMTWNLILATIPAVLAPLVLRRRGPRTAGWWAGAAVVLLFLPNAPYVVTDLVHLRGDVVAADSDLAVVTGVLPAYAAFIAAGFAAYALVLAEVGRYLGAVGLGRWRATVEVALHAACAMGVVLGRVARLNSWEPITEPHGTLGRIVVTLSWRWAPVALAATFVTTWVGHALVRGVARSVHRGSASLAAGLRSALDRRPDPGAA
jgi:uncharacterized membrane protein